MGEASTTVGGVQPPSERDWMLYQVVRVEQWSLREAAKGFELAQAHASQIVQRTADFIARNTTVPSKEEEAQQLAAAKQLAADRIDHLYGQAMASFRSSRDVKDGCSTGRRNFGETRYLQVCMRLALIASTLPLPRKAWPGTLEEEPEGEPKQPRPTKRDNRPAETCSAPAVEPTAPAAEEPSESNATAAAMLGCVEASRVDGGETTTNVRPVQTNVRGEGGVPAVSKQEAKRRAFFQAG